MSSGHLEQDVMMEAFSNDMLSAGSPSFFHLALIASLDRIFNGSIPSVKGISLLVISGSHLSLQRDSLKPAENAPM